MQSNTRFALVLALLAGSATSQQLVTQASGLTTTEAVVFDRATGTESFFDLPYDPNVSSRYSPGVTPHAGTPELFSDEWLLDLSAVNDTDFPWSAQCRIFVTKAAGTVVGSGTIVGPRHIITAGHVVWDQPAGTWGTNVRIEPAWDGTSDAYGNAQWTRLASFTGWTQNGNSDHDMGMIEFDRPLGFLTGTFGMAFDTNDAHYTSTLFNRAGYPGASTCYAGVPNQLYYGAGTFDIVSTFELEADLYWSCIAGGMSGAGVYELIGGSRYVHGISRATGNVGSTPMTKFDTRMTQGKFDFFEQTFMPDGYSDTEMDLVALDLTVETGAGPIGAGETLDSMEYLVANSSLYSSPFQSNKFVDVYLSDDDVITTGDTKIGTHQFSNHFSALETFLVEADSLPTLPADLETGTYWIGVHIKDSDADSGNNITTGWDAAEIEVNARWPELPTTFKEVNDNFYGSMDNTPWLNSAVAINNLDSHSREVDSNAWCNVGQQAACADPFSGSQNLEMGVAPGGPSQLVSNGLILGLDGSGHSQLVLDLMVRDFGEEAHDDDGIFVSEDGLHWEEVYSDWGPLSTTWTNVTGIDLSSTSVDVSGEFYLLFGEQDNTSYGVADGVGIDDVRVHPPAPALSIANLVGGANAQIDYSGGTPGGTWVFAFSVAGGGPQPTLFGPVLLSNQIFLVPGLPLDGSGEFGFGTFVSPTLSGFPLWFQAFDQDSEVWSNGLALVIG